MGAELDSLDIRISASSAQAVKALDKLGQALDSLNTKMGMSNMDHFISGLDSISATLNAVDLAGIKETAKGLEALAKAGQKMASVNGNVVITKNVDETASALSRAERAADSFIKSLAGGNLTFTRQQLDDLVAGFERMFNAADDPEALRAATENISNIVKENGQLTISFDEATKAAETMYKATREAASAANINLGSNFYKEFGDDARRMRGIIGINNTSKRGGSDATSFVEESGLHLDTSGEEAALADLADSLSYYGEQARDAHEQTFTLQEMLDNGKVSAQEFATALNDALGNVGMTLDRLGMSIDTLKAKTSSDDFMVVPPEMLDDDYIGFSGGTEEAERFNTVARETEQVIQEIATVGNPFEGILHGLESIQGISLSDSLQNLTYLKDTVQKIGGESGANAGVAMEGIARGLRALSVDMPSFNGEELSALAKGLRALGSGNIVTASQALPFVAEGLRELSAVPVANAEPILQLAQATSRFGLKNIEKAAANIPVLSAALNDMITRLASAPAVSENTIRLVDAISRINPASMRAAAGLNATNKPLRKFSTSAGVARKSALSLASAIGKLYATYWLLFRVLGKGWEAMNLAADLTEAQNVVDVTFGDMSEKMNEFSKAAIDTLGMSELTAKEIGSRFQAMGQAMHIPDSAIQATNDFVRTATKGYGDVANSMADVSINLTRLAGDMASLYNKDYAEVGKDLEAIFTGLTKPMRKYGVDLTVASMKEFALANGLNADIKSMTQAEKTLLRYQMVMANTTAAHGDFLRTQDTFKNQVRIATERLKQFEIVLGKIGVYTFKPLVKNFNDAMNTIIHLAEETLNALGKIFGWQVEISDVGLLADEGDDFAEAMDDAAGSAKKIKDYTLGIDELNIFSPDNKGNGGGGDITSNLDAFEEASIDIKKIDTGFDSMYDTLFKLGERIGEVELDFLEKIDWDKIKRKMRAFGKGLADFLNGYLSNAELFYQKGRFIAEGINSLAEAMDAFFKEFDGRQLGIDLGTMVNGFTYNLDWDVIKSASYEFAHDIAETINGFVETTDWDMVGKTIIEGINTAIIFASTILNETDFAAIGKALGDMLTSAFKNFDEHEAARMVKGAIQGAFDFASNLLEATDFAELGKKIGTFLRELELSDYVDDIARLFADLLGSALQLAANMLKEAPFETALIATFAGWRLLNATNFLGSTLGTNLANAFRVAAVPKITSFLTADLSAMSLSSNLLGSAASVGVGVAGGIAAAIGGFNFGVGLSSAIGGLTDDPMLVDASTHLGERIGELCADGFKEAVPQVWEGVKLMMEEEPEWFRPDALFNPISHWQRVGDIAEGIAGSEELERKINWDVSVNHMGGTANRLSDNDIYEILGFDPHVVEKTWMDIIEELRTGMLSLTEQDFSTLQTNLERTGFSTAEAMERVQALREAQAAYMGEVNQMLDDNRARHRANADEVIAANTEIVGSTSLLADSYSLLVAAQDGIYNRSGQLLVSMEELNAVVSVSGMTADEAWAAYLRETGGLQSLRAETDLAARATETLSKGFNGMPSDLEKYTSSLKDATDQSNSAKNAYEEFQEQLTNYQVQQIDISALENINSTLQEINGNAGIIGELKTDTEELGRLIEDVLGRTDEQLATFDETLNTRLATLFEETLPTNLATMEETFTGSFANVQEALDLAITGAETSLMAFNEWFDGEMLPRTTREYWTNLTSQIAPAFERAFKNAANVVVTIFNDMIDAINDAMDISWDAIEIGGEEAVAAGSAKLIEIPHIKGYYNGGFPQNGDLFFANERGAELIGSINGKTAVSSNEEITGIRDAVYESSDRQAALMEKFIVAVDRLSQIVEDKELSIGDEQIAEANLRGTNRMGMAIIS